MPALKGVSIATALLAALLLVAAGAMTHDYNTYTGDDPLIGLAALFAIAAAVPAFTGLVLLAVAWLLRWRMTRTATGLAYAALLAVLLPVGLVAMMWIPFVR